MFKEFLPYIISFLGFLFGVWQFVLKQKLKKKERKYGVYLKMAEVLNRFLYQLDVFVLSFNVSRFKIPKDIIATIKPSQENLRASVTNIGKEHQEILQRIEHEKNNLQSKSLNESDINLLKEQFAEDVKRVQLLDEQLESNNTTLEQIDSMLDLVSTELKNAITEQGVQFEDLNITLKECILNFNNIHELNIVASKNVIILYQDLREKMLKLKAFMDKCGLNGFTYSTATDLLESSEFLEFKISGSRLLLLIRQELK